MLAVYQYPKCSTCRNALRWLTEHSVPFESIDIVTAPPSVTRLEQVLEQSSLPIARLFNTSGQSYREGGYKERLKQMSRAQALAALAADGKLIKRPVLFGPGVALVGFDASLYEAALPQLLANSARGDAEEPSAAHVRRP